MPPPLRIFFKKVSVGDFKVFVSRKHKKPDEMEHDRSLCNPTRIQIQGKYDEGVFLSDFMYMNMVVTQAITIKFGYCFNRQLPPKDLLPDYKLPDLKKVKLKD